MKLAQLLLQKQGQQFNRSTIIMLYASMLYVRQYEQVFWLNVL